MGQDLRFAARALSRSPGLTTAAVLTLALAIGANAAVFSVVDGLLIRGLPYPDPERLFRITASNPKRGVVDGPYSFARLRDMEAQQRSFEAVSGFTTESLPLADGGEPEDLAAARVTASLFQVLRVPALLGRTFLPEEDRPGGPDVVVVSHGLWQRRFGGDPGLVGRSLRLGGREMTVVGILPPAFRFPDDRVEAWVPKLFDPVGLSTDQVNKGAGYIVGVARLRPEVSVSQARAEAAALSRTYQEQNPTLTDADPGAGIRLVSLQEALVQDARPTLFLLWAAVAAILLIASANVTHLMLTRAVRQRQELAVRSALGADGWRLVRQPLAESLLITGAGGILGALLAWGAIAAYSGSRPDFIPRVREVALDGRVLGFSVLLSLLTGLVLAIAPALAAARADVASVLGQAGRGQVGGSSQTRTRRALVAGEVASALVLLAGAFLLINTLLRMQRIDLGFDPRQVLTLQTSLAQARYGEDERKVGFYDQVLRRIQGLPGVEGAAIALHLPPTAQVFAPVLVEGQPVVAFGERPLAAWSAISPDYFRVLRIPLRQGRLFEDQDGAAAANVAIVNESFARRLCPGEDPLGKRIVVGRMSRPSVVVGVVGDAKNDGLTGGTRPQVYTPYGQRPWASMSLVIRTPDDPTRVAVAVRQQVLAVDPTQPIRNVETMERVIAASLSPRRFAAVLLGVLAVVALLLAAVGIYGVVAYGVSQRTREIGLRMALGAAPRDVLWLVMGQEVRVASIGVVLGLAAAVGLTRFMADLLYGVAPADPLTLGAAVLMLLALALAAAYAPARRAAQLDPLAALRHE